MKTKHSTLTEGSISSGLFRFTLPIFLGNLFQQLYNTVDTLIVGNFLGSNSLAAVSSSGHIIFLLVGFFNGISIGAGVVIARYYGANDRKNLRRSIHTAISFGLLCGILLTIFGRLFVPNLLRLMRTPAEVLPESISYFKVYFSGSVAFVLYNSFVGVLQSVGDSKHPLYYLIFSSILNVILDLLFIGVFHFGVEAAALATIISQFLSALLCFRLLLFKAPKQYRISLKELSIEPTLLKQIISNGLPTGLQNSIISIANVFVQSNINVFGAAAVAGCGVYSKIEGFAFLPVLAFANALTTCVSQNLGAKNYDRVKKSALFGIFVGVGLGETVGLLIFLFIRILSGAFTSDPEILSFAFRMSRVTPLFFFLCAFSHCVSGVLRGAGKSLVPMFVMLFVWCFLRVSYISVITRFIPQIECIFWAYPLTWTISTGIFLLFLTKTDWQHGYPNTGKSLK